LRYFFSVMATTELNSVSLHDALPISSADAAAGMTSRSAAARTTARTAERGDRQTAGRGAANAFCAPDMETSSNRLPLRVETARRDRKSTRLNSSHVKISYAVFCLKKK